MRSVLLVGGAPRIAVDAVRYLSVRATGTTANALYQRLRNEGIACELLLSVGAMPQVQARRYEERSDLEAELQNWVQRHPDGIVVMSAAINDYKVSSVELATGDDVRRYSPGTKVPSGGDELMIRLVPTTKIIDQLRGWGLNGPLVGFKYEARDTVESSARALAIRTTAQVVVANSLCGSFQALVNAQKTEVCHDRQALIERLGQRLMELAKSDNG